VSLKIVNSTQLKELLDAEETLTVLDVRENHEVALCAIPGAVHIPMQEVPHRLEELDTKARTVVYCHHGMRSHAVASYLLEQGFEDVANLAGGIDGWAQTVDPMVTRY